MDLKELITTGRSFMRSPVKDYFGITTVKDSAGFTTWGTLAFTYLYNNYPEHPLTLQFKECLDGGNKAVAVCNRMVSILEAFNKLSPQVEHQDYDDILSSIFDGFHSCARQLRRRYNGRKTLDVRDEYDVQDLIQALLAIHFDDIRSEEWTPSYAGGNNRMDFLLKSEEIAIEIKMTRKLLKDKEVGEQLIIDIAKYQAHPNCKMLYCFVYDPEGFIRNPRGLERDLEALQSKLPVRVFIRPL